MEILPFADPNTVRAQSFRRVNGCRRHMATLNHNAHCGAAACRAGFYVRQSTLPMAKLEGDYENHIRDRFRREEQ